MALGSQAMMGPVEAAWGSVEVSSLSGVSLDFACYAASIEPRSIPLCLPRGSHRPRAACSPMLASILKPLCLLNQRSHQLWAEQPP